MYKIEIVLPGCPSPTDSDVNMKDVMPFCSPCPFIIVSGMVSVCMYCDRVF